MRTINKTAITTGIIAALIYAIAVWIKYELLSSDLPQFSIASIVTYVLFLAMLVYTAWKAMKVNAGNPDIKLIFRAMFIVILFAETAFALMNYIYLFHINPQWIETYYQRNEIWLKEVSKLPAERKEEMLQSIKGLKETGISQVLLTLGWAIIKDSIFAIIFALVINRMFSGPRQSNF